MSVPGKVNNGSHIICNRCIWQPDCLCVWFRRSRLKFLRHYGTSCCVVRYPCCHARPVSLSVNTYGDIPSILSPMISEIFRFHSWEVLSPSRRITMKVMVGSFSWLHKRIDTWPHIRRHPDVLFPITKGFISISQYLIFQGSGWPWAALNRP